MSFPSYLANDMEEDNQAPKQAIFSFLYGKNRSQRPLFHKLRLQFVRSMGWRTRVSREECEEVGGLWGFGGGKPDGREKGSWRIGVGIWDEKELGSGQGESGKSPWRAIIFSGGCLSFQIQTFDPELWVWGRDRALISKTTEA